MVASFVPGFQTAGGAAGATGGSLLGSLGSFLEPLDYPRQALWNLARSGGRAMSGEGTWDDALRAVPGALGAGLAGGLIASGVGAPLGIAAGAAMGGLSQGVGRAANDELFTAPTAQDITGTEDFLPNLALSMAGDPLTYAGGLGGLKAGTKAGAQFGGQLDDAAKFIGPGYHSNPESLFNALHGTGALDTERGRQLFYGLSSNPAALSELHPGSRFLGHGGESMAFQAPSGHVTTFRTSRFGSPEPSYIENPDSLLATGSPPLVEPNIGPSGAMMPRVNAPEVLPSARSASYGGDTPLMVEHAPFANTMPTFRPGDDRMQFILERAKNEQEMRQLGQNLSQRGGHFWDAALRNVGQDASGQLKVIDPGAVEVVVGSGLQRFPDVRATVPPGWQQWLAQKLGGEGMVQRNLADELVPMNAQPRGAIGPDDLTRLVPREAAQSSPILEAASSPAGAGQDIEAALERAREIARQAGGDDFAISPGTVNEAALVNSAPHMPAAPAAAPAPSSAQFNRQLANQITPGFSNITSSDPWAQVLGMQTQTPFAEAIWANSQLADIGRNINLPGAQTDIRMLTELARRGMR